MLLYDSGKAFVKLDGDILQIRLKDELTATEFEILCDIVSLALREYSQKINVWRRRVHSYASECCYFFIKNTGEDTAGIIFLSKELKGLNLTFDLRTGRIVSKPEFLARASELLVSRFGNCNLPRSFEIKDGIIEFTERYFSYDDRKVYRAIFHVDRAELEYRIEGGAQTTPVSSIYVVRDVVRNGKKYLLFKDTLYPFNTVYYNILSDEIRYDDGYGNKVAEFWKKVRKSGMRILRDYIQLRAVDMLKTKSVDEVLEWYRKQHDRVREILEKNEEVRKLYEKLVTDCYLEIEGCFLAVLPTDYKTLVFIHDGKCDVLTSEGEGESRDWVERRRDMYKVLRRLLDGKILDAVRVAEESGAVKLDEKAAGDLLAEELQKVRQGIYVVYTLKDGKLHWGWGPRHKSLPDVLLPKLPLKIKSAVFAALV